MMSRFHGALADGRWLHHLRRWTAERGQATVELAILLPLLFSVLAMTAEGGLFLGEHISVVNAAREGARYLVDGGSDAELASLVGRNARGFMLDAQHYDVWAIHGQTNGTGVVTFTRTTHVTGAGAATPSLTAATVQANLAGSGVGTAANLQFVAVEVAYRHVGITGKLVLPSGYLTLRSFSLICKL